MKLCMDYDAIQLIDCDAIHLPKDICELYLLMINELGAIAHEELTKVNDNDGIAGSIPIYKNNYRMKYAQLCSF